MKEIEVESYNVPAEARSKNYRSSLTTVVGGGGAAIVPSAVVSGGAVDAAKVAQNLAADSTDWQTIANNRQKAIDALKDLYISKTTDDTAAGTIKFLKGLQIGDVKIAYDSTNGALALTRISDSKALASLYATGGLTAYGAGSGMSGGGTSYDRLDKWSDYTTDKATYILSALLGDDLNTRVTKLENSTLTSVDWSIITGKPSVFAPSPHTHVWADITDHPTKLSVFTNDAGFITASAIPTKLSQFTNDAGFITASVIPTKLSQFTNDSGFITSSAIPTKLGQFTDDILSGHYLSLSGGTMSGTALIQFADDGAWAKSNSGVTFPVKRGGLYWTGESDWVKLFAEETGSDNLNLVLQFGDDNSNGLSIRNASGVQTAYISASGIFTGTLNGNASSASKVNSSLSWSGYSSGSFNGSLSASISIPNNTSQLTNGAGFITSSASISGNAATSTVASRLGQNGNSGVPMTFNWSGQTGQPSWLWGGNDGTNMYVYNPSNFNVNSAVKLATPLTLWGNSFDGTGNICGPLDFSLNPIRIGFASNYTDVWSDGTHTHPWYGYDHFGENNGVYSTVITDYFGLSLKTCSGFICLTNPGAVGINTDSPSYMLDVAGTLHASGAATLDSGLTVTGNILATNLTNSKIPYQTSAGLADSSLVTDGTNLSTAGTITAPTFIGELNGNAATATKLQTSRTIWGQSFDGTGNIASCGAKFLNICIETNNDGGTHNERSSEINNYASNLYLQHNSSTNLVMCTGGGSVGIGTTSPSYKLDVAGTGRFQGDLVIGNTIIHASGSNGGINSIQPADDYIIGDCNIGGTMGLKSLDSASAGIGFYGNDGTSNGTLTALSGTLTWTGTICATGGVTAYTTSDRRLKKNIKSIDSLSVIRSLGGTYQFDYRKDNRHSIGFIAQNVLKSNISDIVKEYGGYFKINYLDTRLISLALGASVELDDEVTKLKKRVSELELEVNELKSA